MTLDELCTWVRYISGDLDPHANLIRELASQAEHVTAFVQRSGWNALLAAGRPQTLIVYQLEKDSLLQQVRQAVESEQTVGFQRVFTTYAGPGANSLDVKAILETDLLVLDTVHHGDRLLAELEKHARRVRRRIVIRGTGLFGHIAGGKDGSGPLQALRGFMRERPEWSVIYHAQDDFGLTVISRDPADKPKLPGALTMAANFAKAMATHVADGAKLADLPALEGRLNICMTCEQRHDDRCAVCGCFLAEKAKLRTAECPLGKWP